MTQQPNTMRQRFAAVYDLDSWTKGSGPGSTAEATREYRALVARILTEHRVQRVLDIGCGDWSCARHIDWTGRSYVGVDVVPRLIDDNQRRFGAETRSFLNLDATVDPLPDADLVLAKDVLQHWTNDEVLSFLPRLRKFPLILLTNDLGLLGRGGFNAHGQNGEFTGDPAWQWRPLDLRRAPFELSPLEVRTFDVAGKWRKQALLLEGASLTQVVSALPEGEDAWLQLIPPRVRSLLHVGCGDGTSGARIKQRLEASVTGIEDDPDLVRTAAGRLDAATLSDRECTQPQLTPGSYDCVLLTDALDRAPRPLVLLRRARTWLSDDGTLVLQARNLRQRRHLLSLLEGRWPKLAAAGSRTSSRLYTRRELEKLAWRAGLDVQEVVRVAGSQDSAANVVVRHGNPQAFRAQVPHERLAVNGISPQDADELTACAFALRAKKRPLVDHGLTSIVIVTRNGLPWTRQCLESIRYRTDEPHEIIVVDNGSTDGTVEYLRSLGDHVTLLENADNRGFPAAANQGIEAAQGRQILLLNNDVVVTTGWLRRQLDALHSSQDVGLVGPCSNCVSGEQQIPVTYADLSSLDGFAWERAKSARGTYVATDRLIGFCLLFKRQVLVRIGMLDEQFGVGNFEDDDFCLRAQQAGFKLLIARDAFIHHFGGATFRSENIDFAALMEENAAKFRRKWQGRLPASARATADVPRDRSRTGSRDSSADPAGSIDLSATVAPTTVPRLAPRRGNGPRFGLRVVDDKGFVLVRKSLRSSLCMITRNNEQTIRAAIESIRPWVDEMIVVDTGSTDRTPEI